MADPLQRLTAALADRYRVEREIGAGGMATVYLARDLRHDRDVAIKLLHPELAAVLGAERFLAEIKTTAKLQHPHILPLLDSGSADGLLFYVMPLVEGETLRARLERETQLPIDDALRIATEIAGALDYAHRHGVIHRDIKPANILLHDGGALVADFGIALAVSVAGGQRLTQTGLSLGTPEYMSPEQAMGERAVDARSDVYSLACVLYEMLVGGPPFTGVSAQAIVAKVLTTEPESVAAQRPTVPEQVDQAIHVALQKLPADRFGTAAQFADALDLGAGRAPGGTGPSRASRASRAREVGVVDRVRATGWAGVVAAVVLVGAGGLAARLVRGTTAAPASGTAPVRFVVAVAPTSTRVLSISQDGAVLLITCGTDEFICVRRIGQLELTPIPGTEHGDHPFLSPNGEWIAFASRGRLRKVRLDGGPVVDLAPSAWYGGAWGRDDKIIYPPANYTGLWSVSATGGTPVMLTVPDTSRGELGHWWPELLPDGQTVLFTTYAVPFKNSRIETLDLRTKRRTVLIDGAVYAHYARSGYLLFTRGSATVYGVPFDAKALATRGEPAPVLEDVEFLKPSGESYFAISETGSLAYLTHSGWTPKSVFVSVDRTGKETVLPIDAADLKEPRLSPDQKRIAYTKTEDDRDIWVFDFARALATPVARNPGAEFSATWTPDGRQLIYMSEQPMFDIYQRAADLSASGAPLVKSRFDKVPTSVSADGKFLAYHEYEGNWSIKFFALTGPPATITFPGTAHDERQAAFSPDGRWLAYSSGESGRTEVYVRPFPNLASRRQQVSTSGGAEPRWTRGGHELAFRTGSRIMVAPFDPASGDPGRPGELFTGPYIPSSPTGSLSYDVTADGNRFLLAKPAMAGGTRDVVVVVNWFDELNRKLAKK